MASKSRRLKKIITLEKWEYPKATFSVEGCKKPITRTAKPFHDLGCDCWYILYKNDMLVFNEVTMKIYRLEY